MNFMFFVASFIGLFCFIQCGKKTLFHMVDPEDEDIDGMGFAAYLLLSLLCFVFASFCFQESAPKSIQFEQEIINYNWSFKHPPESGVWNVIADDLANKRESYLSLVGTEEMDLVEDEILKLSEMEMEDFYKDSFTKLSEEKQSALLKEKGERSFLDYYCSLGLREDVLSGIEKLAYPEWKALLEKEIQTAMNAEMSELKEKMRECKKRDNQVF